MSSVTGPRRDPAADHGARSHADVLDLAARWLLQI